MAESQDAEVDPGVFEQLRLDRPHAARVYDYFLGGKDNFAVDRQAAEHLLKAFPGCRVTAQSNRMWMHRAARYAAEQGITQFLDVGTGIPTSPNLHEIVQKIVPEAHVGIVRGVALGGGIADGQGARRANFSGACQQPPQRRRKSLTRPLLRLRRHRHFRRRTRRSFRRRC